MNERIKELAVQSGLEELLWIGVKGSEDAQAVEKFAELIVRECVRYFNEDYQRDFDTMWREDLSKGIKKHFGVEE